MLLRQIKASNLLSFGPSGIDLPLRSLNVFIGANGSGKSNFLELLSMFRAAPTSLPEPVKEMGGVREWLWKGGQPGNPAHLEAIVDYRPQALRHYLEIVEHGDRFEISDERVEYEQAQPGAKRPYFFYDFQQGRPVLNEFQDAGIQRTLRRESVKPEQSILSQVRDPERYPALAWLQNNYEQIQLFRNWSFGPNAALRKEQSTHGRGDFLLDGADNLALVLSKIRGRVKRELLDSLEKLYSGIRDIHLTIDGGNVLLFLEESGGREIPATRLSDGTLRYLCLLAILLHPNPPGIIAIEEPELGLHPDIIPEIGRLLRTASERTQLFITTHSRMLVDALQEEPEAVVVCEKVEGQTRMERLEPERLTEWLNRYSLGQLWSMGELGGNRW